VRRNDPARPSRTTFASFSSRPRDPGALRQRLAPPRVGWSSPTSKRPITNSLAVASTRARSGTARRSPRGTAQGPRPQAHELRIVLLLQRSRRQYVASPGGHDAAPRQNLIRHLLPRRTWRARFGVPGRSTASTRSARSSATTRMDGIGPIRRSAPWPRLLPRCAAGRRQRVDLGQTAHSAKLISDCPAAAHQTRTVVVVSLPRSLNVRCSRSGARLATAA